MSWICCKLRADSHFNFPGTRKWMFHLIISFSKDSASLTTVWGGFLCKHTLYRKITFSESTQVNMPEHVSYHKDCHICTVHTAPFASWTSRFKASWTKGKPPRVSCQVCTDNSLSAASSSRSLAQEAIPLHRAWQIQMPGPAGSFLGTKSLRVQRPCSLPFWKEWQERDTHPCQKRNKVKSLSICIVVGPILPTCNWSLTALERVNISCSEVFCN